MRSGETMQDSEGAGPQAEELRAANVANLREMVGMAGRHRETLLAVRECILALSPGHRTGYDWNADPLFLTLKEGRALNLIDDALKSTPASPQAETLHADIRAKHAEDMRSTSGKFQDAKRQHATSSLTVAQVERLLSPASVSPVEPEPPTNPPCARCGHALSAHRPEFGACDGRDRPCACPEYQVPTAVEAERAKACHLCGAPMKVEREP